jgi:O-antigen/teichoic acid export membrane protein
MDFTSTESHARRAPARARPPRAAAAGDGARTLRSSAWTIGGNVAGQALRFANNLGLTYLIEPRLLGLMGTVHVFLSGLQLMSDFGVGPSLIQNPRGEERAFQDTAWTLHVVRGAMLWLVTLPLGPLLAWLYRGQEGAESLMWLVPMVGLVALIGGCHSTAIYMRNRRLDMRPLVLLDLGAQLAGCAVGLLWGWLSPSLWALVAGVLTHQIVYTTASWRLGPHNRPRWERETLTAVVRFGRWIWFSTMLTWGAQQIDRLLLPALLRFDGLAVYQVAAMIAVIAPETVHLLGSRVLFPAMAELVRGRDSALSLRIMRMRRPIVLAAVAGLLVLAVAGDVFVHLVYPGAFRDAGWMLRLLAVAAIPQAVIASSWYGFFALGRSAVPMLLQLSRLLLKVLAMYCGWSCAGMHGVVVGIVAAEMLHYPIVAVALHRHGILQLRLDLPVLAGAAVVAALGFWLR